MTASESGQIRILIVDDHKILREGLRMLIGCRPEMVIVGEAERGEEALAIARREHPDIVLLDLDLNGSSSLDFLPELLSAHNGTRVLVLTGMRDPEQHRRAMLLGAMGLVFKEQAGGVLLRAIEKVHAGEAWIDRTMTADLIGRVSRPKKADAEAAKIASLTEREREIVVVICEGLKNNQIAKRLFISEATVRNHVSSILSKLGLSNRFELAIYSYRRGLAKPPGRES